MQGYYIGMDGGGTGTDVLVTDGKKDLLRVKAGGLNYNSFGPAGVAETFVKIKDMLKEKGFMPEDCLALGIGCAGISNPDAQKFIKNTLSGLGFNCPAALVGDQKAAMYGAFEKEDGILLISGTGSICLGQMKQGSIEYRAGGFGHLIDDEGSAYALGRDILSAVVRAGDGREKPTALTEEVFKKLDITSVPELIGYVYAKERTKKETASLAALLSRPGMEKDQTAIQIIDKAVLGLAELVYNVYGKMKANKKSGSISLVLHGSVLLKNDIIKNKLLERLMTDMTENSDLGKDSQEKPELKLASAKNDAAHGAAGLAILARAEAVSD